SVLVLRGHADLPGHDDVEPVGRFPFTKHDLPGKETNFLGLRNDGRQVSRRQAGKEPVAAYSGRSCCHKRALWRRMAESSSELAEMRPARRFVSIYPTRYYAGRRPAAAERVSDEPPQRYPRPGKPPQARHLRRQLFLRPILHHGARPMGHELGKQRSPGPDGRRPGHRVHGSHRAMERLRRGDEPERDELESITWACGLLAATQRINVFATVHVPLNHPVVAAKQMVTADHIGRGRFGVNVVCGWNEDEFAMFGVTKKEHEDRYAQGAEWWTIIQRIWAGEGPFD